MARSKDVSLTFGFKGGRDYVHGTDMFNRIIGQFDTSEIRAIKFNIHGFITNPECVLHLYDNEPESYAGKCRGSLVQSGKKRWFEIVEAEATTASPEKTAFDESLVTGLCEISGNTITLAGTSPFSFIETIVPMNKYFLNTTSPDADGKWIFTGLELPEYREINAGLSLDMIHNFQNKLVKTSIRHDGKAVGTIYFSLIPS